MALGGIEVIVIIGAIIFLFGGNKGLDWIKKFNEAKNTVKEEMSMDNNKPSKKVNKH